MLCIFAGCADINTDAYVFQSENSILNSALKNVRFSVSSSASLLSVSSARTIAPAAYNANELNFYLGGKNIGTGENLPMQQVEFVADKDSNSSGTIVAPLNSYNYLLVLLALPKTTSVSLTPRTYVASLTPYAVLAGNTTADLRYNNDAEVNFYLSSEGLHGNGGYDIKFYLSNWSSKSLSTNDPKNSGISVIDNVSVGLYTLSGNSLVSGTDIVKQSFASAKSKETAFSYSNSEITAGTYDLCVTFSYDEKYFVYSDKIIILPYQTTSATIGIPDILQVVPDSPSNLKQGYILPENDETNYYKVAFSWEDNANTESGFELQLLDVSELSSVTVESENNEATWQGKASRLITSYSTNFKKGNSNWFAGNFSRNSTSAILYVPLGKRYLARIRSYNNDIGRSEWCYASSDKITISLAAGDSTATNAVLDYDEDIKASAFDSEVINLFRVTYNLSGGTFSRSSLSNIFYFDYISGGVPILTPNGTSTNGEEVYGGKVSLKYGEREWSKWVISSIDGDDYPMSYTRCNSSIWGTRITYYEPSNPLKYDINGEYVYVKAEPQPEDNFHNFWICNNVLANYIGYKNLSLYAVYKDENGTSEGTSDYSIKNNLEFTVTADGNSLPIENFVFNAPSDTNTLLLGYRYTTTTFTYDTVTLTLSENGGNELGTYSQSGNTFYFSPTNLNLGKGIYTLTVIATKSGSEFKTSLLMNLN